MSGRKQFAGSIVAQFLRELHVIGASVAFKTVPRENTLILSIRFGNNRQKNPDPLPENVTRIDFNKKKAANENPDFTPIA